MKTDSCETSTTEQTTNKGLFLLSRLFRSKSADKKKAPKSSSSKHSSDSTSPKRRFMRVVRDDEHVGEEYQNPHVIRRYTKGYWEEQNIRKASSLEDTSRPLPYTVSGHTILKKHSFPENDCHKRATFNKEVQVIVFSRLEKTANCKRMAQSLPLVNSQQCLEALPCVEVEEENSAEEDNLACEELAEAESVQEDFHVECGTGNSDSEQSTDDCVLEGQFASLVAADEKDMHANRCKRKLSSSSGSSNGSQLTREA